MAWIEKSGNKYKVRWDSGTAENRIKRAETFDTFAEADQHKKKIEYELSIGTFINLSKMTFGEYLDYWLSFHNENLAIRTQESYESELRNHIKPRLGDIKLAKLAPLHLQECYSYLRVEGKANMTRRLIAKYQEEYDNAVKNNAPTNEQKRILGNLNRANARLTNMIEKDEGGLSNTTINYQHRIIRKALNQAVKWQMVAINVADAVDPPKAKSVEITYLRKEEINRFISCIKKSSYYPIFILAILTGMRQGEILGLRWIDVDFNAGVIKVRQQVQRTKKNGYVFLPPKQQSIRDIPMPLPLNAVFREVRKEQSQLKEIFGTEYEDLGLVFCAPGGQPLSRSLVTKNLKKLLIKNDFEPIRFHALRHTFATMARAAGVPMEDIQDILGHADISTTKNMYTHVEIEPLKESIDKLTAYLDV